jgi:hypothetical protein
MYTLSFHRNNISVDIFSRDEKCVMIKLRLRFGRWCIIEARGKNLCALPCFTIRKPHMRTAVMFDTHTTLIQSVVNRVFNGLYLK